MPFLHFLQEEALEKVVKELGLELRVKQEAERVKAKTAPSCDGDFIDGKEFPLQGALQVLSLSLPLRFFLHGVVDYDSAFFLLSCLIASAAGFLAKCQ